MPRRPRRERQSTYPEPGAWVLDKKHGLPSIDPPEPLDPKARLTTRDVDFYVAYEGLGFCVFEYIPARKIADPVLAQLWETARLALRDIVVYLEAAPIPAERVKVGKRIL